MEFKQLTDEEKVEYRQWARENYEPFGDIKGIWHPTSQQECVEINRENRTDLIVDGEEILEGLLSFDLGGTDILKRMDTFVKQWGGVEIVIPVVRAASRGKHRVSIKALTDALNIQIEKDLQWS